MARKIIEASPSFSVKGFKKHYKFIDKIKKNICKPHTLTSKFSNLPIIKGKSLGSRKISEGNTLLI